jgi:hypothetical protein
MRSWCSSPLVLLRQPVGDVVEIGFRRYEDVFSNSEACRLIQSASRNVDIVAIRLFPKHVTAAARAEAPAHCFGRLKPSQRIIGDDFDLIGSATRHCGEISAGFRTLRAMTRKNGSEPSSDFKDNAFAKAAAGFLNCH